MSRPQTGNGGPVRSSEPPSPTWRVVLVRELRDLWIGGKALYLILIYTILLGIYSYLLASNAEVNLMPLKEMVTEMVRTSVAVSLFICLLIGADSVAGERERATLEALLLTPASRRQVVVGKFLAALSPWPLTIVVTIPYWNVLSRGDEIFGQGLVWGPVLGALMVPALAGLGMLVSLLCNSNKSSMVVSIGLYLLLMLPTEFTRPGKILTTTDVARTAAYVQLNPWNSGSEFLGQTLLFAAPVSQKWTMLILPALFSVVVAVLLFAVAGRDIRLEPGTARKLKSYWDRWRPAVGASAPLPATSQRQNEPRPREALVPRRLAPRRGAPTGPAPAGWWAVCKKELRDLWVGGRALNLAIAYTIVVGVYSYMIAQDSTLSLVPPQEMVYELLKAAMVVAVFMGLIIGADSLSGERERTTIETLLLTPARRSHIVVGKFLAAISPWPLTLIMTVPYLHVLAQGDEVFGPAVFWTVVLGTILTIGYTALGMFVSFWCGSNKTSMFVSLCLYLVFLLPTQLPGHAQAGFMGQLVQWLNPMGSPRVFLSKLLVNNRGLTDMITIAPLWTWLLSPAVFSLITLVLLFAYATPGLQLEPGRARRFQWSRAAAAGAVLFVSLVALGPSPALAVRQEPVPAPPPSAAPQPLQISIDMGHKVLRAGESINYKTVVTNNGAKESLPMAVAMNIINLNAKGDVVDPEDWSPERTQHLKALRPGQSVELSWRINAILDGNFMVYMVVIPKPEGPETTSHPVASSGIHLTVTPFTRLNPGGVIPYAVGGPVVVLLGTVVVQLIRRRQIDAGGGSTGGGSAGEGSASGGA